MSDSDANIPKLLPRPMTTEALLRRTVFLAESLYDLETLRKPMSPQIAVRYDRTLETLCAVVDELARRAG